MSSRKTIVKESLRADVSKDRIGSRLAFACRTWAPQPMTEDTLLTGPLEPTNQWYAVAKIAGLGADAMADRLLGVLRH